VPPVDGEYGESALSVTVLPAITGFAPRRPRVGQLVTVRGTGFSRSRGDNAVRLGGHVCAVHTAGPTELVCQVLRQPLDAPAEEQRAPTHGPGLRLRERALLAEPECRQSLEAARRPACAAEGGAQRLVWLQQQATSAPPACLCLVYWRPRERPLPHGR
jgi:hypothetical protein